MPTDVDALANEESGERIAAIPPSPQIQAVDDEIQTRFSKRTGTLERFLNEWLKLDSSQDILLGAVGVQGENYFQHILAKNDIAMAHALANICGYFAQTEIADRIIAFMNHNDSRGNDLWHYLARCLTQSETEEALEIAKILIDLEISFTNKNEDDETALSKLLLPQPRWRSINSMNAAKELTIDDLEEAFSEAIHGNEALKQEIMVNVFSSDLVDNDGQLTLTILKVALSSQAERPERARAARLFFDAIGGPRRESIFMKTAEVDQPKIFDLFIDLMTKVVEDETREVAARDGALAFARQQVLLYKKLSIRNRTAQNIVVKAVIADKPKLISTIMSILKNENLMVAKKDERGDTIRANVTVDEKSAAPQNPALSLLLQLDARGNTAYHTASFLSRSDCLKRLFGNLSMMDSFMIASKIPNRYGVTVEDSLEPKRVMQKLGAQLRAGKINQTDANQLVALSKKQHREVKEFLGEMIARASETIERTGGLSEAKPTFDLKRIPTVAMQIREMMKRREAAKAAQG